MNNPAVGAAVVAGLSVEASALGAVMGWLNEAALRLGPFPVSRAELAGAVLGLAMVACNLRLHPAGWGFAAASSILYGLVFWDARLYGEASLQIVFVLMAGWGALQWLGVGAPGLAGRSNTAGKTRTPAAEAGPRALSARQRGAAALATLLLWGGIGVLLDVATASDVPYFDALPTAASLVATWLLAHRYAENWLLWLGVNAVSVALFAWKALWPTVGLYAVFALLSWLGWRQWRQAQAGRT